MAQNHAALDAMVKGDSSGYVALLSDHDDVTWGNPFGPFARGRKNVEATLASAAERMRGGRASDADRIATYLAENLAVVVEVEHAETKAVGAEGRHDQPSSRCPSQPGEARQHVRAGALDAGGRERENGLRSQPASYQQWSKQ